jgi:hypothetical protein
MRRQRLCSWQNKNNEAAGGCNLRAIGSGLKQSGASMYKIAGSVVGLLMLPAIALAQQPTELNVGWLSYSAGTISQDLSVRNNGLLTIKTVIIGCRFSHVFMHYSKQLGAGTVEIENIASNTIGYKTMTIASKISPTSATCHIVSVTRPSVQY